MTTKPMPLPGRVDGERFWNYLSLEGEYTGGDDFATFYREKPKEEHADWKLTEAIVFTPEELAARDREMRREGFEARGKLNQPWPSLRYETFEDFEEQRKK